MMRGLLPLPLLPLLVTAAAAAASYNLTGAWSLASSGEGYKVSPAPPDPGANYTVACVSGPCSAWHAARLSLTDPATGAVWIAFDSGASHGGNVTGAPGGALSIAWADGSVWVAAVPLPPVLDVHLFPHSHTDPGWQKTVDAMYNDYVRGIFDGMVEGLHANPARTFVPEIGVFWARYVADLNASRLAAVRALVASGAMEFAGGGWVQPDEAITRFEDVVDQLTLGHAYIAAALGAPPPVSAWQADPFGRSASFAALLSKLALQGFIFGRPMSAGDPFLTASHSVWHPSASAPDAGRWDAGSVLTHDQTCGYWEPFRSCNGALSAGNATAAAAVFRQVVLGLVAGKAPAVATVPVFFGDDAPSGWNNAATVWPALDAMLEVLNADTASSPRLSVRYSTPSRFYAALAAEVAATGAAFPPRPAYDALPLLGGEFPAPWTGYYTSRPEYKAQFHAASSFFRAASQLHAFARDAGGWQGTFVAQLLPLWQALGLVQHHDAITGDSWDDVMADFAGRVASGVEAAGGAAGDALAALAGAPRGSMSPCLNASAAACAPLVAALEGGGAAFVTVYNPTSTPLDAHPAALLPVQGGTGATLTVTDVATGARVPSQLSPPAPLLNLPGGDASWAVASWAAGGVAPHGWRTYKVEVGGARVGGAPPPPPPPPHAVTATARAGGGWTLSNGLFTANFTANGTLAGVGVPGVAPLPADAAVEFYSSPAAAENAWDFTTHGATASAPFPGVVAQSAALTANGSVAAELVVVVDGGAGVTLRYALRAGEGYLHVYTTAGPFPAASPPRSMDAVLRVRSPIASAGVFHSDGNGLEFQRRVRNERPWAPGAPYVLAECAADPVSCNYAPLTAAIYVAEPGGAALALATSSSHGGASMADGAVEVMVARVLAGLPQGNAVGNRSITAHNVLVVAPSEAALLAALRPLGVRLANPPVLMVGGVGGGGAPPPKPAGSPLSPPGLPPSLQLLSLQLLPPGLNVTVNASDPCPPPAAGVLLLRLRHVAAAGEPGGGAASVDVAALFDGWAVVNAVEEVTLDGATGMAAARAAQTAWPQAGGAGEGGVGWVSGVTGTVVTLQPMEVGTYRLDVTAAAGGA